MKIVSAIVPAYNEEKSIRFVLEQLKNARLINEIICVNDGSLDNTISEIKKVKGIKVVDLKKNRGKSYAIVEGIRTAKGDIVLFVDADLDGKIAEAADELVTPLINGTYDVTVGYPLANSFDKFFRPLSGERAYYKHDLEKILDKLEKKGYGMELFLNFAFKDKRIDCFPLNGLVHKMKHEKQDYSTVVKLTVIEVLDIFSEVFSQKNPPSFFLRSYVYSFYLKQPNSKDSKIERMIKEIKEALINQFRL
ncbi:hypothetical protein A2690_03330 [Candidatus Roizmanbacteria bacterium RIFCSPHIGHO2_01_FULL_39_12b]|uniref:Glycosyltransferase 2-like domain-containing protein n=1 Tax=Candidatus Roizmanbacteria bacterium RIFCSPHIGHO2_01_FULL_39_12b TaxID=1802030 RepID=A0A1F7GCA8_9BACT|nr:MAG: hypothetical protein A2690_03330 [Candidatus Roizmanbacteria bacterium RIFCSPHIGHO2_01_FULL_39_12b]OGK46696.1 MAG: hypothetical protein A3B46_02580 [Candidatus Roizmanbacteria bacterium RIFCSPLOWO2_01_FULL_39_19]